MKGCLLILRRDFARSDSHDNMTFYYEGLVDDFGFAAYILCIVLYFLFTDTEANLIPPRRVSGAEMLA